MAKEIALFLGISGCKFITKNPDRKSIFYTIQPKIQARLPDNIIDFLKKYVVHLINVAILFDHTPAIEVHRVQIYLASSIAGLLEDVRPLLQISVKQESML